MAKKTLFDRFGRRITYLRMSVTDRCNFRCIYCMPEKGIQDLGRYDLLSLDELVRIAEIFVEEGIQKIRLTGGEPLLRENLDQLVAGLSRIRGLQDLCLTTNGCLLEEYIQVLADAGLQRVNVSLDSLNLKRFERITGGGDLRRVLRGVEKAARVLPGVVKINVVVLRDLNDDEILDFARMTLGRNYHVRFIERMPAGSQLSWEQESILSTAEMKQRISDAFGLEKVEVDSPHSGPSSLYRIPRAEGRIGFIGPVTDGFCAQCNRIRLTPDGKLCGCLMADSEVDLLQPIRRGAADDDIRELLHRAMHHKPEWHTLYDSHLAGPPRTMSQIGG